MAYSYECERDGDKCIQRLFTANASSASNQKDSTPRYGRRLLLCGKPPVIGELRRTLESARCS